MIAETPEDRPPARRRYQRAGRRVCPLVFAIALVGTTGFARAAAVSPADEKQASELIKNGLEMRRNGDNVRAAVEIQKAYDLVHSPRAAAQLGFVEQALGRWVEANDYLSEALAAEHDAWVEKNRGLLRDALQKVRTHVAQLEISGEPTGADVVVDGKTVGKLPLRAAVTVNVGSIIVSVRAPGYTPSEKSLTLGPDSYERVAIRLEREVAARPAPAEAPAPAVASAAPPESVATTTTETAASIPAPPSHRSRKIIEGVAFGVAAVSLATGVVAFALHEASLSDFNSNCYTYQGIAYKGSMYNPTNGPSSDCQAKLDRASHATTFEWVGFAGAAAFAAAGTVLYLTQGSTADHVADARAAWVCAPQPPHLTVGCQLRF
jgi:hypothetical protein